MKDLPKEEFLNQRSDKFTIVLNDNDNNCFESSRNIYTKFVANDRLCVIYIAVIYHNRDYDRHLKQLKTKHYHVVIHLNCVCRIGTMINYICDLFKCNDNQITIDKCNSLASQSRYLCHLDDFDKESYDFEDVVSNDYDVLSRYFNLVFVRDLTDLVKVVRQYNYDLEEIMCHISNYDKWRKYVTDLIINYRRKLNSY